MNIFSKRARSLTLTIIILLVMALSGCGSIGRNKSGASNQSSASAEPIIEVTAANPSPEAEEPCSQLFSNFFVDSDSISYDRYEVSRVTKTVYDKEWNRDIPVTYAVLKSGGKTIITFDGVSYGLGNETDFGFASLLGGETTQLVVSETVPRGGRQWIVDLSSNVAIVFDTKDWGLSGEDLCVSYDPNGVAEISSAISRFQGFGHMAMVESPLPAVTFRYDMGRRRYALDKEALVQELNGIERDVAKIDPAETLQGGTPGTYLARRLDILFRYVYAGREHEGWSFFDVHYNLPNKNEIEREIRSELEHEPVYRFVYGKKRLS